MSRQRKGTIEHKKAADKFQTLPHQGGGGTQFPYTFVIQPPPDDENRNAAENDYRKRQLRTANILNVITAVGTVVALLGLFYLGRGLKATERAARIADDTLHVSERAYIALGEPDYEVMEKYISIPILNTGHIPSGVAITTVHEATFYAKNNVEPLLPAIEAHWERSSLESIATGNPVSLHIALPNAATEDLTNGRQMVALVGDISYNDGFPDTPNRVYAFCYITRHDSVTNKMRVTPCQPSAFLPFLKAQENYPNNRRQDSPN